MMKNNPFLIAHISDPHICVLKGVKIRELMNKRILGWLSWHLHRRYKNSEVVLQKLCRDLMEKTPDHVMISGDLTQLGTPLEFKYALEFLKNLGPPGMITVVPGNHDVYVNTDWDHTFAHWQAYMSSDVNFVNSSSVENTRIDFPIIRLRGHIALIGISTAIPSAPFFAIGSIGSAQLSAFEKVLVKTGNQGFFRIVIIHHPPLEGAVGWRKRLVDAQQFRSIVKRCGAELIVHGHSHRRSFSHVETHSGQIPVICTASTSSLDRRPERRARYHLYRIHRLSTEWKVELSEYSFCCSKKPFICSGRKCFQIAHKVI
jgi:3',5'-cyclic AMP phosphodiesterase CpdA